MKIKRQVFIFIFSFLSSLILANATMNVSICGAVLNETNMTYTLNQSISIWNADSCIIINATNVTLDCLGYNITYGGDDADYIGIDNLDGFDNITIKNCVITQNGSAPAQHAIYFEESENAVIFNNTIRTFGGLPQVVNGSRGIYLDMSSTNANISSNTINTSGDYSFGIFLGDSNNSIVNDNIIITSGEFADAIRADSSPNSTLISNNITISGDGADGIFAMMDSGFSIVYNNIIITSGGNQSHGINLDDDAEGMNITLNTITTSGDGGHGITAYSKNNNLTSNTITTSGNESHGIYLSSGNLTLVYSNAIITTGTEAAGIYIDFESYNNLTNNAINTTNGFAIWVAGLVVPDYNHTVQNNTEQGIIIYYLFSNNSEIISNKSVGQIFAANSYNLTLNNLTLSKNGITFIYTNNSIIKNSNITLAGAGIEWGIGLSYSYSNNITNNTIKTSGAEVDGIYLEAANNSIFTQNKIYITGINASVIDVNSAGNNTFYDNLFNASTRNSFSDSGFSWSPSAPTNFVWNTTKTEGINIVGRSWFGGNYWTNNASNGYSDTCTDSDGDYICDSAYDGISDYNVDYLPLAKYTVQISGCRNLTFSDTTHTLNQSFNATGACIQVQANNITIDFNGSRITGDNASYGINITNYNNTIIKNAIIYNFSKGIYIENSQNSNITNVDVYDSGINGIYIFNSNRSVLSDITSNNNGIDGIYFNLSSNNVLSTVIANDNGGDGIKTEWGKGSNNTLTNITANNNAASGIYPSNNSRLTNITVNNNTYGISIGTSNNILTNVTANGNSYYALWIGGTSANNTINNLNANNSGQDAIYLTGATSSNIFTNATLTNTNRAYYDINFNAAGINGTWIIDSDFANYTFTGAGSLVNFKNSHYGIISFLQPINGSGANLSIDVNIGSNLLFVNSSNNAGLNKSANITISNVSYADPKPQYSIDGITFADCNATTSPICSEISLSGNDFMFNTTHFTSFRSAESYVAPSGGGGGGGGGISAFWTDTYVVSDKQFEDGYAKELGTGYRMRVSIDGRYNYVGVTELTEAAAALKIFDDSNIFDGFIQTRLISGEDTKIDVTKDGFYDIHIKLLSIQNNKANITVQSLYEKIPEKKEYTAPAEKITEGTKKITGETAAEEKLPIKAAETGKTSNLLQILLISFVVIAAGVWGLLSFINAGKKIKLE